MVDDRFERNVAMFGDEGQRTIRSAACAVVGVGGLGTHVVQQLALLGVGALQLIDSEEIEHSNRNRYVGVRYDDPIPGTSKVDVGERLISSIDPDIRVGKVHDSFISDAGFDAIRHADYVFGCVDSEGARLILTELCSVYSRPYIDLASDVIAADPAQYGGRVCVASNGNGCLVCLNVLDRAEAGRDLGGEAERRSREVLYGVDRNLLGRSGPSVVSINGVVASLGVTEFIVAVTGLRLPQRLLNYYGSTGRVTGSRDTPQPDCYYCKGLWGCGAKADVERYVRDGLGERLR